MRGEGAGATRSLNYSIPHCRDAEHFNRASTYYLSMRRLITRLNNLHNKIRLDAA